MNAFREWQAWAYEHMPDSAESPFLMLSLKGATRGQPWSVSAFTTMWREHVRSVPELTNANPHILRHTFASELTDAGVEPLVVQELLGHLHPDSTAIYTHAHMDTLTDAVARLADWRDGRNTA